MRVQCAFTDTSILLIYYIGLDEQKKLKTKLISLLLDAFMFISNLLQILNK